MKILDLHIEGNLVRLEPMDILHRNDLLSAATDGQLWDLWFTSVPSEFSIDDYMSKAFRDRDQGLAYPFVIIRKADNKIVGSTRYCNMEPANRRLEIGYTWYAQSVQRTGVNTECKYLLLRHAFEQLDLIAVEFRTHWYNTKSRNAILRLGAKQDGVLRNHRIDADGAIRDTVVFSIIRDEWLAVKRSLEFKIRSK